MIPDSPSHLPAPRPNLKSFRPPKTRSRIAFYLWRAQMWIEGTFVLAMLEPWEKLLLLVIFLLTTTLLVTGIVRYLPHHLSVMHGRAVYYLWGNENGERSVLQWIGKNVVPSSA